MILPKDDPNQFNWRLLNIVDDAGRKVEYRFLWTGALLSAKTNETYNGSSLVGYQEADYTYDSNNYRSHGWLQQLTTTWNTLNQQTRQWQQSTLAQNVYGLDNIGQRLTNQITDNTGATRTETYVYDDLDRLSSVNYGDGQTQSYQFDAMGNRLQKQDSVNGTENSTYNNANMLLTRGANNYFNDMDGNTLSGGGRTNTWDSENRLAQCVYSGNTCVYTYGADGIRHRGVVNGVTIDYVLDGPMFVRELQYNNGVAYNYATYLIGARGPEYRRDDVHSTVRWYVEDGLGSVLEEVDPNGNVTASRKYDVYGSVRSSTGTGTSKHEFVGSLGHPSEAETGLIYMQARYMDPVTGRFESQDPALHGVNWYSYCGSNPVSYRDANGKDGELTETTVAASEEMTLGQLISANLFSLMALTRLLIGFLCATGTSALAQYLSSGHVVWSTAFALGGAGALTTWLGGGVPAIVKELTGGAAATGVAKAVIDEEAEQIQIEGVEQITGGDGGEVDGGEEDYYDKPRD